jgi:hypothetical protein
MDISRFVENGGSLTLYVNGAQGGEDFTVYLENREDPRKVVHVRVGDYVDGGIDSDTTTWQKAEIPLADFDIVEQKIDPKHIRYIGFSNTPAQGKAKVYVDDIFFSAPEMGAKGK